MEIRMKDEEIVIVGAARTPVGSFNGSLASQSAHALFEFAIRASLERAKVDPADVNEVIMGQVLTAAQGQNPARQAAMAAGVPKEATAWGVNQVLSLIHISEPTRRTPISYAVFCLKK